MLLKIANLLTGKSYDGLTWLPIQGSIPLETLGTHYGGATVPLNFLNRRSICYCAGAGEDISFELEIAEKYGCQVFIFDPTPRAIKYYEHIRRRVKNLKRVHYHKLGLWDKKTELKFYAPRNSNHVSHSVVNLQKTEKYFTARVDRLSHIMKRLHHSKIDLLKMDIEGAEYKVIDSVVEDKIRIPVVCVEFNEVYHSLDANYRSRIKNSLTKLRDFGYQIVAVKKANYCLLLVK